MRERRGYGVNLRQDRSTRRGLFLSHAGFMAGVTGLIMIFGAALAQGGYPNKPIRVIITLSPGSANDIIPRFVLDQVAQSIGQPFVFENRPGASGTIAANAVAKANPDGYTILALSTTHAMAPGVIKRIPYDTAGDFAGITTLASLPHLLVTGAEQKVRSIQDLVAAARSRPGGMTFGAILGAGPHLNAVHFLKTMGIEGRLVPFKGAPEALMEVMAGRVDIYFSPITPALPFLQSGRMQAIAVTSKNRSSALPDRNRCHRSWSHPQEPVSEALWAEVLADPRARIRTRRSGERTVKPTFYRLRDEQRDTILVTCSSATGKPPFGARS